MRVKDYRQATQMSQIGCKQDSLQPLNYEFSQILYFRISTKNPQNHRQTLYQKSHPFQSLLMIASGLPVGIYVP